MRRYCLSLGWLKPLGNALVIPVVIALCTAPYFSQALQSGALTPQHDDCPKVNDCTTNKTDPNEDDMYRNANISGPMTPVNNTQGVNPDTSFYSVGSTNTTGLQGSMPGNGGQPAPMPSKNTPAISLVDNFPWLYKDIDQPGQYAAYRGTGNNTYTDVDIPVKTNIQDSDVQTSETLSTTATNPADVQAPTLDLTKCFMVTDTCAGDDNPDYTQIERWVRLQYDSCTEQYILPMGLNPDQVFSADYRNHQFPWNESMCQPLRLKPLDCIRNSAGLCNIDKGESDGNQYDYRAWGYLELAWKDLLDTDTVAGVQINGGYLPNGGVANEATGEAGGGNGVNPVLIGAAGNNIGKPNGGIAGEAALGNPGTGTIFVPGFVPLPYTPQWGQVGPGNALLPLGPTWAGNRTTIDQLAAHPYERIWDPTHPYTPRWDFAGMDRDYSQGTGGVGAANAAHVSGPAGQFQTGPGYDPSTSPCIVRCASVPVDILTFRQAEFNKCMECRIQANTQCFWSQTVNVETPGLYCPGTVDPPEFYCGQPAPAAYISTLTDVPTFCNCKYPLWNTPGSTCKSYYDLKGLWPVCSTKYDYPNDNVPPKCATCLLDAGDTNPLGGVTKCCNDLAQALAPINTLKIRNTKFDPTLNPTPEGYRFQDYFPADADGNPHMPFMRWWDTGMAAGGSSNHGSNYDPNSTCGYYDTIVGVGRDGGNTANNGNNTSSRAKYCRYGGNGTANTYDCLTLKNPDALTSWMELKLYQTYAMRDYGLSCLVQYEKVFKQYGTEDGVLSTAGGYFNSYYPLPNDSSGKLFELKTNPWPLRWRGYLSDPDAADTFLNFGGAGGAIPYAGTGAVPDGLDNAKTGDIIYLNHQDVLNANEPVFPFAAVVTSVYHAKAATSGVTAGNPSDCQSYVEIIEVNNGKYPDVCGDTNYIGFGQARRIYKEYIPPNIANATMYTGSTDSTSCGDQVTADNPPGGATEQNIENSDNCADPKLSTCTYAVIAGGASPFTGNLGQGTTNLWNVFHIYRPTYDVRQ